MHLKTNASIIENFKKNKQNISDNFSKSIQLTTYNKQQQMASIIQTKKRNSSN